MRLVSSNDEDSYNSNAFYLSDNVQTSANTPFAAMIAKQQTNYAIAESNQDKRATVSYGIGVPGKDSVKEVRFNSICKASTNFDGTYFKLIKSVKVSAVNEIASNVMKRLQAKRLMVNGKVNNRIFFFA